MGTNKNQVLFYTGTMLLAVAVFELTVVPYIINTFFPVLYIPLEPFRTIVTSLYIAACVCYMFCSGYYKKQMISIATLFVFYILFQIFLHFA